MRRAEITLFAETADADLLLAPPFADDTALLVVRLPLADAYFFADPAFFPDALLTILTVISGASLPNLRVF